MGPWLAYTCQHTCKHGKSRGNTIAARLRESADLGLLQDLFSSKLPGKAVLLVGGSCLEIRGSPLENPGCSGKTTGTDEQRDCQASLRPEQVQV